MSRFNVMPRATCWLFGHKMESHQAGHGTAVEVRHCARCSRWWFVT